MATGDIPGTNDGRRNGRCLGSVLGGLFAGTGWLLVVGGMRVTTGLELDASTELRSLFEMDVLARGLPGLNMALLILGASRVVSSGAALPLILSTGILSTGAGLSVFVLMFGNGSTLGSPVQSGWLLRPLQQGTFDIIELGVMSIVVRSDWSAILGQWPNIGTVVAISSISIILTVSALVMLSCENLDINTDSPGRGLQRHVFP